MAEDLEAIVCGHAAVTLACETSAATACCVGWKQWESGMQGYTLTFGSADGDQISYEECNDAVTVVEAIAECKESIAYIVRAKAMVKNDEVAILRDENGDVVWHYKLDQKQHT